MGCSLGGLRVGVWVAIGSKFGLVSFSMVVVVQIFSSNGWLVDLMVRGGKFFFGG